MIEPFRDVRPGGDVHTKMPKVGNKIVIKRETRSELERIANELMDGTAFVLDPRIHTMDCPEPWFREAHMNAGTLFMSFKVRTHGAKLVIIGYKNKTKIDVLLEVDGDVILEILKEHGREDISMCPMTASGGSFG